MIAIRLPSHFPVRATEWMLASIMFSYGLLLLVVPDLFVNSGTSAMMAGLRATAPQPVWGAISFVGGAIHLSALWVNGTRRKSPHWRAGCSVIGFVFWVQVLIGLLSSGVISTGLAIYPWVVVFSVYNVVRAMQDARQSDDRAKAAEGLIGGSR